MKGFKRIIAIALAAVTLISLAGCSKCNGCNDDKDNIKNQDQNHVIEVSDTETMLVDRATSEYKLVVAKEAHENEINAAREIQTFFAEATGITLPIITDEGITVTEQSKYISVGRNALATAAQIKADAAEIKEQGFVIKTIGNTVYLLGASTLSTIYAAYDFLKYHLNYEYYFTDVYSLDRNVAFLKLKNLNITEIPDIDEFTTPSSGVTLYNTLDAQRMRVTPQKDWLIPVNSGIISVHNVFHILPPEQFKEAHPKWYSGDGSQICFTAGGDAAEYQAMVDEFINVIKRGLAESSAEIFSISQMDKNTFCGCDACRKAPETYGANSALVILLCNRLSDYFTEWFETEEGKPFKRDLKIMFLAYQQILDAPAKLDEKSGKYVANSEEVKCRDNVGIYFAADSFYYTYDLDYATNQPIYESMKKWGALTNFFTFWVYDVNFNNYFYPYDSFYSKAELYEFMFQSGTVLLNDQSQTQNKNGSVAWGNLKSYLSTKLRWNIKSDIDELTKGFFKTCYLDMADEMYSVYLRYKFHANEMKAKMGSYTDESIKEGNVGSIFGAIEKKELWAKSEITVWYNTFKSAYEAINQKAQTDESYERAAKMIAAELVSPLYMMISLYGDEYSTAELNGLKAEFKSMCTKAEILFYYDSSENGEIENLYDALGIV